MYKGYKIVACIPAGRKRVMNMTLKHLRAQRKILDGVMLWLNTTDPDDRQWIKDQADDFVQVAELSPWEQGTYLKPIQLNTGRFYRYTVDPQTIYMRFDDDVIWFHKDAIKNLIDFRIDNPEYFVVFANIWNNAIISALAQRKGLFAEHDFNGNRWPELTLNCMDDTGWKLPRWGEYVHRVMLQKIKEGAVEDLFLDHFVLEDYLRFSVSAFAWFGKDWAAFEGDLKGAEEETWITGVKCKELERPNAICGNALVSHYSFFTQRPLLDMTDILPQYQKLADEAYHDAYYDLIAVDNEKREPFVVKPWWE